MRALIGMSGDLTEMIFAFYSDSTGAQNPDERATETHHRVY